MCALFMVIFGKDAEASIYKGDAVLIGMKDADGADRQDDGSMTLIRQIRFC